jgi:hypothetical protein
MATTTFSGPVVSKNGFDTGTSASPLAVTTAQNVNAAFVQHLPLLATHVLATTS